MKIKEVYELFEGIKAILDKELPIKVAFLVQKNLSAVQAEIKNAEEVRQKLEKKYVDYEKLDKDESKLIVNNLKDGVKFEDFNNEFNELMDQEAEVKLKKIKIDDLDGIKVKPIVLNQLQYIISE